MTAHNAFAYFAKEFGFEVIAVAGLEQGTEHHAAGTGEDHRIGQKIRRARRVSRKRTTNEKTVRSIATTANVAVAHPLIADGNGTGKDAGFEGMIRHNVSVITPALGGT